MDEKTEQQVEAMPPTAEIPLDAPSVDANEGMSTDTPRVSTAQQPVKKSKRPLYIALAIVFVVAVTCGVYFSLRMLQKSVVSSSAKSTTPTASSQKTVESVTPVSAEDTAIDTNLNDIDSTLSQASTEQTKADSAMSDSNQQITVPTE